MKKQRIVLASVLKPIDDTRMFEKLGKSLATVSCFEVTIMGYPSKKQANEPGIHFFPLPKFRRLSVQRMLAPLFVLQKTYQVRPEVLIVNTHELLVVALINRILFGTKIVYDLQENYWRNILWTNTFPPPLRLLLALWVRSKEAMLSRFFQLIILAEKCFEHEMKFLRNKPCLVLENKSSLPSMERPVKVPGKIRLLFSGTISESTGILEAIRLATALHTLEKSVELTIIGYCAVPATLKRIKRQIENKPFVFLQGGDQPVPHSEIIKEIFRADFGIICYPASPHTENRIPTKLYEYLSAQLPILIWNHHPWVTLCAAYQAALPIDALKNFDASGLLRQMKTSRFYSTPPTDVFWSLEEDKLIRHINSILI